MHCRLPLPTATNIPTWWAWLEDYHDNIICDYMEFGWSIRYMADDLPQTVSQNHTSSIAHPHHVDHFLAVELQHSALLGPFPNTHPLFTFVATSPLMSRPKKNSEHRRIIMDFSFPIGSSVNSGIPKDTYLGTPYKLHYPTVDDYVHLILHNGVGCLLYRVDLARAAYPLDYPLLGISWNDKLYIDTAIGFGLRTGSMICQRITDAIGYIMGQRYGAKTLQYVDDCVGVERNDATARRLTQISAVLSPLSVFKRHQISCALPPHAWNLLALRLIPSPAPSASLPIRSWKSWLWSAPGKAGHVPLNISYSLCLENCIMCRNVSSQLACLSQGCLTRYAQPPIGGVLHLTLIFNAIRSGSQISCPHIKVATWCNMSDSVRRI